MITGSDNFIEWDSDHADLVYVGLGDPFPDGFESFLQLHNVSPVEFHELLCSLVEIIFGSFYGAPNDASSMCNLQSVIQITGHYGISPPSVDLFSSSSFNDHHGWGNPASAQQRDTWRFLND